MEARHIMTISFKQVKRGNLLSRYNGLWYKIKGAMVSFIERHFPFIEVTQHRIKFVEAFIQQFKGDAMDIVRVREQIHDRLGALPFIFGELMEWPMPRTDEGEFIINSNAVRRYNTKARRKKWPTMRSVDELAFMMSQVVPECPAEVTRKQCTDVNGSVKRGKVITCDLLWMCKRVEQILDGMIERL
jgi:hypothetical protein